MPQLDGLRAVAVLAVMIHHWFPAHMLYFDAGNYAVLLFFTLSGFLITGILVRARCETERSEGAKRRQVFKAFYARRALRIFPVYYAAVVILLAFDVGSARSVSLPLVTYTHNLWVGWNHWTPPYGHFWTLAVEEQFYLFWPLVVLLLPRRLAVWIAFTAVAATPFLRGLAGMNGAAVASVLTTSNLAPLAGGSALALLGRDSALGKRLTNLAAGLGALVYVPLTLTLVFLTVESPGPNGRFFNETIYGFRQLSVSAIAVWLVAAAGRGAPGITGRVLQWPPLVYCGTISYGLYIYHSFAPPVWSHAALFLGLPEIVSTNDWVRWPFLLLLTFFTSAMSWHCFERPINKYKHRYPYVPDSVAAGTIVERPRAGSEIPVP
nr:acyltransferase [Alienimonas californiensis]